MIGMVDKVCGLTAVTVEDVLGRAEFDPFVGRVFHQVHLDQHRSGCGGLKHVGYVPAEFLRSDFSDISLKPGLTEPVGDGFRSNFKFSCNVFWPGPCGNKESRRAVYSFFLLQFLDWRLSPVESRREP